MMRPFYKLPDPLAPRVSSKHIPWRANEICLSYGWPTGLAGGGVIAIIELGGGWAPDDMAKFFGSLGQPVPMITDVSVDGAMNRGVTGDGADIEVALDIQLAGCAYFMATGKPATIRVYWADNANPASIANAVTMAAKDGCDTVGISWGAAENVWGPAEAMAMEHAAEAATAAGMIVFAAAGDNDSSDGEPGRSPNVDLPAGCPHVIGCGGTSRPHDSNPGNPETVWNNMPGRANGNGTGGGFSRLFPTQVWQVGAPLSGGRMVPDIAANADPQTGYHIIVGGMDIVVGGTSAVAPLYAGLFAGFGKKLGFVTPKLWQPQDCWNDIIHGNNGMYHAQVGPDPCTGLGSPKANKVAARFTA